MLSKHPSEDDGALYSGGRHARFIDPDVPIHVVARVFQGMHLLRPCAQLNSIIYGVFGRAQRLYPQVDVYAKAFMSNHVHVMLRGPAHEVPSFVGFVLREISRRWARQPGVDWEGTMFSEYIFAALPTAESQIGCLKYVLSQGTKEHLVESPYAWPGVNSARDLARGEAPVGRWVDYTALSRATDSRRRSTLRARPSVDDFTVTYSVRLAKIPAWSELGDRDYQRAIDDLVRSIERDATIESNGRKPMGAARVMRVPLRKRSSLPRQPWFAKRRRLVCWAARHAPETTAYHARYRAFQAAFCEARDYERRTGKPDLYPTGAFRPGWPVRDASTRALAA